MNGVLSHYQKVEKPWGYFEQFVLNDPSTVKILSLNPGQEFSLQRHNHREEFWRIIFGDGTVTIGDKEQSAVVGDEFLVPEDTLHRALAGENGLKVLEISFGDFDEKDIERIADDYGRV